MAINVGYARAGWAGLCAAGVSFIVPAALITGAFAWAYVRFGGLPQAAAALAGIKPAVIAIISLAIWRLGKAAIKDVGLAVLGAVALAAFFLRINPIAILFLGGLVGMSARRFTEMRTSHAGVLWPFAVPRRWVPLPGIFLAMASGAAAAGQVRPSVARIGLFFLKVGAVLYGGGYVLLAFLEQGLVRQHGWLTQQQLLTRWQSGSSLRDRCYPRLRSSVTFLAARPEPLSRR
jgi:chromate transporter